MERRPGPLSNRVARHASHAARKPPSLPIQVNFRFAETRPTVNDYELIDFGEGRKLERVGGCLLDRPSPAAEGIPRSYPKHWARADGGFERVRQDQGTWTWRRTPREPWVFRQGSVILRLRATPFGHLGVFPEHAVHWDWIERHTRSSADSPRVLNLFGYTGGATLAASWPHTEVVHVDASRPSVLWARENATHSHKDQHTIRWIVEDARVFCRREVKRGRAYDAIILDPPSYGHGAKGATWSIERDLPDLLADCDTLLSRGREEGRAGFLLFTCHSPTFDAATTPRRLLECMETLRDVPPHQQQHQRHRLNDAAGRSLDFGIVSRWTF